MPGNKLSYFLVAITLTLAIFVPQAQADTNQKQSVVGDTVFLNVDKTKITFKITSNDSSLRNLVLNVAVGKFRVHRKKSQGNYTVTYNSCTDSDQPTWRCMEAQITLWREEHEFQNISFSLYNILSFGKVKTLSTIKLQRHRPPTTAGPTDQTSTTASIVVNTDSNKGALDSASMGLIIAVAVCVLIIVALIATLAIVVVYMKRNKNISTQQDPEQPAHSQQLASD